MDCQRGCRYFNIEFLTTAADEDEMMVDSKVDLKGVLEQCKTRESPVAPFHPI